MNTLNVAMLKNSFDICIANIASDKSISHRSAIFSMLCDGTCVIDNYLLAQDTLNTLEIIKSLGAKVDINNAQIKITPPKDIKEPENVLECGNSGTAIRLFCGFLASFKDKLFILNGDSSIRKRPMSRVISPLNDNGANIIARGKNTLAPIVINGADASGFEYTMTISSAQVKSAMILYALSANTKSIIYEPKLSRNHTEIMLSKMGVNLSTTPYENGQKIVIESLKSKLKPFDMTIPSDPSSGFFFAMGACLIKGAKVELKNILLNDTRIEAYKILQQMGAKVEINKKDSGYEDVGDIIVEYAPLKAITIDTNIAWLIDEIPALAIAFIIADGVSKIKNAKELRAKESDRISSVVNNLKLCGIDVVENEDGFEVIGCKGVENIIKNNEKIVINSYGDHRIAMSFAIFSMVQNIQVNDIECINTSFPTFVSILENITKVDIK
jgi:3-phosphoshikimate 1-carboxyvinyltransferase